VGTVYSSRVKDAGLKTSREFKLTEFEQPTKIHWTELTKNAITVPDGGYDLEPAGDGATHMTISNTFEGHGFGKVLRPLATRAAKKGADAFAPVRARLPLRTSRAAPPWVNASSRGAAE
jgi:hypothetical protein